jgi:hypothetical protein
MDQTHPDPVREAISHGTQRAVQVGSCAMTAAQAYAWHHKAQARVVAERDERARRSLQAQIRAEREAARSNWAPALDRQWLRGSGLLDTARAWGAAMPYANRDVPWYEPSAATAMRAAEDRLRDLHPYAMARYQRLRGDGLGPTDAMREAAPLFARHPHARDAPFTPRPEVEAVTGAAEWVARGASADAADQAGDLADAAGLEQRGQRIAAALQERARADGREPLGQDELRIVLDTITNLPADVIDRLSGPAAAHDGDAAASAASAARRSARPWEHDFPAPIRDVVAAAAASPGGTTAPPAAAARPAASRAPRPAGPGHGR